MNEGDKLAVLRPVGGKFRGARGRALPAKR